MASSRRKLTIGVIGCGHWGPNHIRVFSELERTRVTACCDLSQARLDRISQRFPGIDTSTDYTTILDDDRIDAVVVATPTATHAAIVADALRAGKNVLVEKPLCLTGQEGEMLTALAEKVGRVLMVGHVFLFNAGIVRLRRFIQNGDLGSVQYLDAVRTNLGPVRGDVNALYDLATHDISIFNYLLDAQPIGVSALGGCISQERIEDVCFATIQYPDGTLAHIHVSWLNPRKVRTLTVVGSKKMAHWDDIDPQDTLRVFDKGLEEPPYYDSFGEFQCLLRTADVHMPAIQRSEPLMTQAEAFADWVLDGKSCRATARDGLAIVRTLEAAMESLANGGAMTPVTADSPTLLRKASASAGAVLPKRRPPLSDKAVASTLVSPPDDQPADLQSVSMVSREDARKKGSVL